MSKGPEANFWNTLRSNLPKNSFATRIENKHGGGVPDVHMVWDGLPFWMELKVSKGNGVNLSAHQIAWNMAYFARGGLSFFLVKRSVERDILLFGADQGPDLARGGISAAQGARFDSPAALFAHLGPLVRDHYALRLSLRDFTPRIERPRNEDTI